MTTIFGGIHCMAWFFAFCTHQEQVLWRMSAVVITCTPWFSLLVVTAGAFVENIIGNYVGKDIVRAVWSIIVVLFAIILYITARAVLLVLMFTTLRNLPPGAYKAVLWTSLVPHL
ncbi:hypothetical protein BDR04DRAFT_1037230 [Suillus decipiens]|nr:hypothetical protein BDR04DRAFT_1037230 [Suillus decipiens]